LELDARAALRVAETFRVLGDPTRVRIVALLSAGEARVGDLADWLGLSASAVSHQLGLLRAHHVVRPRRLGREVHYSLDDEHVAELFRMGVDHVRHRPATNES
jgi:DNA-binding transcriptional ArsR family regulator